MNPLRPGIATALILGLVTSANAQSEQSADAWDGVQATLGEFVLDTFEEVGASYQEAVRHYWLTTSDITMTMTMHDEGTIGTGPYAGTINESELDNIEIFGDPGNQWFQFETPSNQAVYAEFDWDNFAMSMHVSDSGNQSGVGAIFPGIGPLPILDTVAEATDVTMYFDADGNVYVPQYPDGHLTEEMQQGPVDPATAPYMRANLPDVMAGMFGALQFGVEAILDSRITDMVDDFLSLWMDQGLNGLAITNMLTQEGIPHGAIQDLLLEYINRNSYDAESETYELDLDAIGPLERRLVEIFSDLLQARYDAILKFPMVNFAFFYSPTLVRTHGNVQEEPTTWNGQPGATRFTVTSGDDEGYVMMFDGAGRLVLLRDTNGDTAEYSYDRDLTVRLPTNILNVYELMRRNTQ